MCFCHFSTRPLHTLEPVTPKGNVVPHALCSADVSQFDGEHFGTGPVSVSHAVFSTLLCKIYPKTSKIACSDVTVTSQPRPIGIGFGSEVAPHRVLHNATIADFVRRSVRELFQKNMKIGIFSFLKNHVFRDLHPIPMGAHFPYFLVGRSKVALFVISKSVCRSDRPFSTYSRFALSKIYYYEYIDMLEQSSK